MKKIDGSLMIRGIFIIALAVFMVFSSLVYNYYATYKSINVSVKKQAVLEYGEEKFDIKDYVSDINGKIKKIKKDIDTKVVGEQEVVVEVEKDNIVKEVPIVIEVVDSTAPAIEIKNETVSYVSGEGYNLENNIGSVVDVVDGNVNLKTEEDSDNDAFYTVSTDSDINEVGEHVVTVVAQDKRGNKSTVTYNIVTKKPEVKVQNNRQVENRNNNQSNIETNVVSNAPSGQNATGISSLAYSLVGSRYVSGGNSPGGFDCSGFVQYVLAQNGVYVSRSSSTQARDGVGVSYADAQPGDILSWGHGGRVTHSAIYVGNGMMVHATNPSQGVVASSVAGWDRGSYDSLMAVRRVQ